MVSLLFRVVVIYSFKFQNILALVLVYKFVINGTNSIYAGFVISPTPFLAPKVHYLTSIQFSNLHPVFQLICCLSIVTFLYLYGFSPLDFYTIVFYSSVFRTSVFCTSVFCTYVFCTIDYLFAFIWFFLYNYFYVSLVTYTLAL